jgi:transposase
MLQKLNKMGGPKRVRCCYEAGPTGCGLHPGSDGGGVQCIVVAPSSVPKQVGSRVKTDRRDAVKPGRFPRSDDLTAVAVPDQATEAMRDLEPAREDAKNVERSARHQLGKFCCAWAECS